MFNQIENWYWKLEYLEKSLHDRQRESTIVRFSIKEAAIACQIESSKRQTHDVPNIHWERVDRLIEEQDYILKHNCDFNEY